MTTDITATKSSARKKKHHLFCLNFKEYVRSFIKEHKLIHPDKKIMISVSGGVDSIALADIMGSFGGPIELLHFNHGTRGEQNVLEEKLVMDLGARLEAKVNLFRFDFSLDQKNFEQVARKKRREIYQKFIDNDYWIYTAHHIDDSFEWTLMQSFKQSGLKSTLGIPVFGHGILRPFMCVTKKQILRYARAKELSWLEDSSNKNTKFERNYLRATLTQKILKRYPNTLRHYVSRHNQLAGLQNLHRSGVGGDLKIMKEESGSVVIISDHLEKHKAVIKDWIHSISSSERGEIDHELDKLLSAHKMIMQDPRTFPFKGPMNFSGGVVLFLIKDHLFITHNSQLNFYKSLDRKIKNSLQSMTQIPESAISLPFPQLIIDGAGKKLSKSSKFIHPLLPVTCLWLKQHEIPYTFTPLIPLDIRQKLIRDAVILDSSDLGL